MKKLYMAYGSNLNLGQMARRCPTAKVVGTAMLEGYQLLFNGVATIVKRKGAVVPVGIWEIDERCEAALDRYEGYPTHYTKQNIDVNIGGEKVEAMVYVMNQRMNFGMPSSLYYDIVSKGYDDFDLDKNVLLDAVKNTAQYIYTKASQTQEIYQSLFDLDEDNPFDDPDDEYETEDETLTDPFYYSEDMRLM